MGTTEAPREPGRHFRAVSLNDDVTGPQGPLGNVVFFSYPPK